MKPPCRSDSPAPPVAERLGADGVVYVEKSAKPSWEDIQRSRSHPHSGKLLLGAFSFLIAWLSIVSLIGGLIMSNLGQPDPWNRICIIAAVLFVISLVTAIGISLTTRCPLCHGTPLHARHRCHPHRLANHWIPFTRRATVVLRILTTLSFRCMYCGTPFRLFKKSSRRPD